MPFIIIAQLFILVSALFISACSGGSSSNNDVATDAEERTKNPDESVPTVPDDSSVTSLKVNETRHARLAITEANAATIATDVHNVLTDQLKRLRSILDEVDLVKGANLTATDAGGQVSDETITCERGGTWRVTFTNGKQSYTDEQGLDVDGAGAVARQAFDACGSEYYQAPFYLWGATQTEVVSGLYDNFSMLAYNTVLAERAEHFIVATKSVDQADKQTFTKYLHGDTETELDAMGHVFYRGEYLAFKEPQAAHYTADLQLHNFEFEAATIPGNYSWDKVYSLNETDGFKVDLVTKNQQFSVRVIRPYEYSDLSYEVISGEVEVLSEQGVLMFTVYEDYIEYRLDTQNDGDFELTAMLPK